MFIKRATTFKGLLIQFTVMGSIGVLLVLFFFFVWLPYKTNHGETLTVPQLVGENFQRIDELVTQRDLRYEVVPDSAYNEKYPPLTILQQDPQPNSKVKKNRKIYLTLNSEKPPVARMPCLIDGSIKNAQVLLASAGLKLGKITYKPDRFTNSVLEQSYKGKAYTCEDVKKGVLIPKGSSIDIVAADGLGNSTFEAPSLVGRPADEVVEFVLPGQGLQVGTMIFTGVAAQPDQPTDTTATDDGGTATGAGIIVRQRPVPGAKIRIGQTIDLWVSGTEEEYLENKGSRVDSLNLENVLNNNR